MPDTRRSLTDILALFADNTAGDISAQDARDMIVSIMGADSLFTGATKNASFTAEVGQLYPVDVSAATANIDVTFPTSPVAGDTFGFYVAASSTTAGGSGFAQAPYWGVEPLTSTDINNIAFVQATGNGMGEWGLMVVGELLTFRWDDVTSTWVVYTDRRLMANTSAYPGSADATNSSSTAKNILLDTLVGTDKFGNLDVSAGNFEIKRTGKYWYSFSASPSASLAADKFFYVGNATTTATALRTAGARSSAAGTASREFKAGMEQLLGGNELWAIFISEDANKGYSSSPNTGLCQIMEVR